MRYAIIKDGVVDNVIVWDEETSYHTDGELVSLDGITAGVGWTYDGSTFIQPPEPELDSE